MAMQDPYACGMAKEGMAEPQQPPVQTSQGVVWNDLSHLANQYFNQ
jgi:hypothetical protein